VEHDCEENPRQFVLKFKTGGQMGSLEVRSHTGGRQSELHYEMPIPRLSYGSKEGGSNKFAVEEMNREV